MVLELGAEAREGEDEGFGVGEEELVEDQGGLLADIGARGPEEAW